MRFARGTTFDTSDERPTRTIIKCTDRWAVVFACAELLIVPGFLRSVTVEHYTTNRTDGSFDPATIGFALWTFSVGYSVGPSVAELHQPNPGRTALAAAAVITPVLLLVGMLVVLGVRALRQRSPRALSAILLLGMVPLAFAVAGSMVAHYPFNVRYVVVAFPAFVVLLAFGILSLPHPGARWAAAGALVLVDVIALRNYYHDPRYAHEDNRDASAFIAGAGSLCTDLVVVSAPYTSLALDYYLRHRPRLVAPFPGGDPHGDPTRATWLVAQLLGDRERFWLFLSRTYRSAESRLLQRYADSLFVRDTTLRRVGVEATRYVRRPSAMPD